MRNILTLSISQGAKQAAIKRAKQRGFCSVSEYVRFLLDEDDDVITVDEVLKSAKQAEKEYRDGKCIDADSVSLMDIYYGKKN